jgi:hypothetical protein
MGVVGGFLPGKRLKLQRSLDEISSNPDENFAEFDGGQGQPLEML